jgi:peptidoglycan-associated lipoprotein
MKKLVALSVMIASFSLLSMSCQRSANQAWEDVKTAGRYINRGVDTLCGKNYDSQLFISGEELLGPSDADFIPLSDSDLKGQARIADAAIAQPKHSPGEQGVPNLDYFRTPSSQLANLFHNVNFETDDHVLRSKDDLMAVQKMAGYLKKHANTLLCVEGHCDERASAAYNLALGTRRANHLRVLLVKYGVDANRIYTVSFGKEKPVALGHSKDDLHMNRRSQFKLFDKK